MCDGQYVVCDCLPFADSLDPSLISRRAIYHNRKNYADPDEFRPERYLGPSPEFDPEVFGFGLGRRYVCVLPGRATELLNADCPGTVEGVWGSTLRRPSCF